MGPRGSGTDEAAQRADHSVRDGQVVARDRADGVGGGLGDGSVVISAITSCTSAANGSIFQSALAAGTIDLAKARLIAEAVPLLAEAAKSTKQPPALRARSTCRVRVTD